MWVVTALTLTPWALSLAPGPAAGQAFWREDAPKLPMAPTWLAEKATLPPYSPTLTPEGVPDLQGVWGASGGDGLSYLEDHEYVDVTTPAQETFISDPPDGKVPYTPWAMAKRNEILAGLARGWPGESGERLYASPSSYCLYFMPEFSFEEVEIVREPGKDATQLLRRGLRRTDFETGTEVIVNGYLARSGEPVVNGRSVTTPEGRNFFLGTDPGGPVNR